MIIITIITASNNSSNSSISNHNNPTTPCISLRGYYLLPDIYLTPLIFL